MVFLFFVAAGWLSHSWQDQECGPVGCCANQGGWQGCVSTAAMQGEQETEIGFVGTACMKACKVLIRLQV